MVLGEIQTLVSSRSPQGSDGNPKTDVMQSNKSFLRILLLNFEEKKKPAREKPRDGVQLLQMMEMSASGFGLLPFETQRVAVDTVAGVEQSLIMHWPWSLNEFYATVSITLRRWINWSPSKCGESVLCWCLLRAGSRSGTPARLGGAHSFCPPSSPWYAATWKQRRWTRVSDITVQSLYVSFHSEVHHGNLFERQRYWTLYCDARTSSARPRVNAAWKLDQKNEESGSVCLCQTGRVPLQTRLWPCSCESVSTPTSVSHLHTN